jgi:hypothetical protein
MVAAHSATVAALWQQWLRRLGCEKRHIKIGYCEVFKPAILFRD